MKTGIDIVEIDRFKNLDTDSFINKYFTDYEKEYIKSKKNFEQTLAGLYACKEAILKAFKIGIGNGIKLKEIEIYHVNGVPFVKNNQVIEKFLNVNNCKEIDVSISHTAKEAIAICIIL